MKKAINVKEISEYSEKKRLNLMLEETRKFKEKINEIHVSVSVGNRKTGVLVPSISLRPRLDCVNCKACGKLCYDLKNDCCWENTRLSRANNAAIWECDPKRYFDEISASCKFFVSFRWHIGGDIVNREYLNGMIRVANENPQTKFLTFTKAFKIVNAYLDEGNELPKNLQIIFSGWVGLKMDNPHNLPTAHPLFADGDTSAADGAKLCTGNCSVCLRNNDGCWSLKHGEQIVFPIH